MYADNNLHEAVAKIFIHENCSPTCFTYPMKKLHWSFIPSDISIIICTSYVPHDPMASDIQLAWETPWMWSRWQKSAALWPLIELQEETQESSRIRWLSAWATRTERVLPEEPHYIYFPLALSFRIPSSYWAWTRWLPDAMHVLVYFFK